MSTKISGIDAHGEIVEKNIEPGMTITDENEIGVLRGYDDGLLKIQIVNDSHMLTDTYKYGTSVDYYNWLPCQNY